MTVIPRERSNALRMAADPTAQGTTTGTGRPRQRPPVSARLRSRLVNPVACRVLRSPAHRLLSRSLLLLEYTGRRSGRRYRLPVGYAADGDRLVVAVGHPEQKTWWRNFGSAPRPVTVTVRGRRRIGAVRRLAPDAPEREQAVRAYARSQPRVPLGAAVPMLVIAPVDDPGTGR